MTQKITGILVPIVVPFTRKGEIDEHQLREFVDWLIERGVHGLFPNGSSGEFTRLSHQDRRRVVEIVVDQAAGRVPVIAGATEENLRLSLEACNYYHRLGVRAVAVVPPYYYPMSQDNLFEHFKALAAETDADILLYNIPKFTTPIAVNTVMRLVSECSNIIGIKDSSGSFDYMLDLFSKVRSVRPDFSFLVGWESLLAPGLILGWDGGTNTSSNFVPEVTVAIYEAAKAGDFSHAMAQQLRLQKYFACALTDVDFPEGVRRAICARGFQFRDTPTKLSREHLGKLDKIEAEIARLLQEDGLAPAGK